MLQTLHALLQLSDNFVCLHNFILFSPQSYPFPLPFHNFFQTFSPFSLHVSIFIPTFAIATNLMRSTPHNRRARRYVQAQPTLLLMSWAYFFAHTSAAYSLEARPSVMRSTPHKVWRCSQDIRRFAFHVFFCPSRRISMRVVADEEVRSAFFRTLSSNRAGGFPATRLQHASLCKQLHPFSAQLNCAR